MNKKTIHIFGDSYFQENAQQGWVHLFLTSAPQYEIINLARGGASLDWIENQIALRSPPKPYNNLGMVVLTHPRRLWITPVHLDTANHGNCSYQLRQITNHHHAPTTQAQLEYLEKNNLVKSYQHVYDLLADDEDRWLRDVRKILSSINQLATYYEKFFVFFGFTDTLNCYKKLARKNFSNISIIDQFCFDYLFDHKDAVEAEKYRKLPNHMSEDENYGFYITLLNALETGKFNYKMLQKYWRKNRYYKHRKE